MTAMTAMTARELSATLPLRRWLVLALIVAFALPFVVTVSLAATFVWSNRDDPNLAVQELRTGAAQWRDPVWQTATTDELRGRGIEFVLFEDGQEVYRSAADPLAGTNAAQQTGHNWWASTAGSLRAQELVLPGTSPQRTAYLFVPINPIATQPIWVLPLAGFSTLLLTLAAIGWVLGHAVVRPLGATSAAARRVATGELDIVLPSSRVREVAEVNAAFEAMSRELRQSVEQQTALEQERRLFIGAVTHDLRTPLFAMRGYLEGLAEGVADTPEKAARYVAVAQEKAAALERLITDLFDYTRLEYLDQAPNREPLDLCLLLRRLIEGLQPQAGAKGVRLTLDPSADECITDADSHLLTRALENLLDNALRYTPSGGSVCVSCERDADYITFAVADSGPGIPAHDLPHVFTPLYRGETSRNRRTGGAGLGLTIARRILLAHGGELTAENGATGGAIFRGKLPGRQR